MRKLFQLFQYQISQILNGKIAAKSIAIFSYAHWAIDTSACLFVCNCKRPSNLKLKVIRISSEFKWMRLKLDAKHVSYSVSFDSREQFLLNAAIITSMIMANALSLSLSLLQTLIALVNIRSTSYSLRNKHLNHE